MKKLFVFAIMVLAMTVNVGAQTKLTDAQQKQVIDEVDRAARAMSTMQCDFTQTKTMKMLKKTMNSQGLMYYKRPDKLRWQYTTPYDYTFIINGGMVSLKSQKTHDKIDVRKNKMFDQITKVILNSITGSGLKNSADFTCVIYKNGNICSAKLYPKKKELKQVYQNIEIFFNAQRTMVTSVKMEEKTGDTTIIRFTNVKTNAPINEKVFAVQ